MTMRRTNRRNIGAMRDRLELFVPVRVSDGALGSQRADTSLGQLWGRIEPISGRELFRYQHLEQELSHVIIIRFKTTVKQGMYLKKGTRQFYVEAVMDPDERGEFQKLVCREGGQL